MSSISGVTVAICCYNSASRLTETLQHLLSQQVSPGISWEVLVIDNASNDNTGEVAHAAWQAGSPAPLRVIVESTPGLSHARVRALHEARHTIINFIDDDNWVSPDWIQTIHSFFQEHPDVGALGGCGAPVFESDHAVPWWFEKFAKVYAAAPQYENSGDITDLQTSLLWGAGFSMRTQIFRDLESIGFCFRCSDRTGTQLTSCGDTELCLAIRALGWRLYYLSTLQYQHFIPSQRLTWTYLRNSARGAGRGSVYTNILHYATNPKAGRIGNSWFRLAAKLFLSLSKILFREPKVFFTDVPGANAQLAVDTHLAQLGLMFQLYPEYGKLFRESETMFLRKRGQAADRKK